MAIWIDEWLCGEVKKYINETWPEKKVKSKCKPRSWSISRYIQVSTPIKDMNVHYELYCGRVQLHFEGEIREEKYKPFLRYLRENVVSDGRMQWRKRGGMTQGMCEIDETVDTLEDVCRCLKEIIETFDPIIKDYLEMDKEMFPDSNIVQEVPELAVVLTEGVHTAPKPEVKPIGKIEFHKMVIPPYQRPYKWTAKNVNQLITDIITFRNKKRYRLGTLVLHNNEIVDGQQRIITLSLLLKKMYEQLKDEKKKAYYKDFINKVDSFANSTKFQHRYSLHNVVENIHTIEERLSELNDDLFDFILEKCEFVVITLSDISEAFQFFDSQNARGKDLAAHDLLKAYHLREMEAMTQKDSQNIDYWQLQKTDKLQEVFLTLYRAKRWSEGKTAKYFTKNNIGAFKGVSLRDGKRYPFYQMEIIAHIFSELYAKDPMRDIDQNKLEYPFNLDDQIVNGSRFFDMIRHYMELYENVRSVKTYEPYERAQKIFKCINEYDGMERTGDEYVRCLFDTTVLYYIDRFGYEELDKVIPKLFIWAYTLRMVSPAVQRASADNYAMHNDSMIRFVHEAKTPYDIINRSQLGLAEKAVLCTKCDEIKNLFRELKKIYPDD